MKDQVTTLMEALRLVGAAVERFKRKRESREATLATIDLVVNDPKVVQAEEALRRAEVDWVQLAREVRRRKFGAATPRSLGERAKQARFLQYRGFDAEQLRAAFRDESGEGEDAPDITPDITFEAE